MAQVRRPAQEMPTAPRPMTRTVHPPNPHAAVHNEQYPSSNGFGPQHHSHDAPLPDNNNNSLSRQYAQSQTEEGSISIPISNDDDDDHQTPAVSADKKHLPVFARFPFHASLIPPPPLMETNADDSLHGLRLRLIDSELNYQRRSTNEYIKRTHRIGMEIDLQNGSDLEHGFDRHRIQNSFGTGRYSHEPVMPSNYSYESHRSLLPLHDPHYSSSNMDDLIDSMARRHLASRRGDARFSPQRGNGYYGSYSGMNERADRASLPNEYLLYSNRMGHDFPGTNPHGFNQPYRTRGDYHNRIQAEMDPMDSHLKLHGNSHPRLPPIASQSHHAQYPSNSHYHHQPRHVAKHQPAVLRNVSNRSEHLIELPSDIFIASQAEASQVSARPQPVRQRRRRRSRTDPSDGDNDPFAGRHVQRNASPDGDQGFFTEATARQPMHKSKRHRRSFRNVAMGILFTITLKRRAKKNQSHHRNQSPSLQIHKIRLQEIIVALHRVYLEPNGPIYTELIQAMTHRISLKAALDKRSANHAQAIQIIGDTINNVISRIVEFMPKDGVLGTAKTSAVSHLIQDGHPFPPNYFWQCEKDLLKFDDGRVVHITKQRATLLIIGLYVFRALVTTLLIKPIKYRLLLGQLTASQAANSKVLASVILYVARRAVGVAPSILALPHEWQLSLFTDEIIKPIIQHAEIKSIVAQREQSLRRWCEEYIRRIDASNNSEPRT